MDSEIVCIANFVAKPNQAQTLQAALEALVAPTRAEAGCLRYQLCRSQDDTHAFTMVEAFADEEALAFHRDQPYLDDFKTKVEAMVDAVSVQVYTVIL
ncbi:MAG TPA: antibiotic biosynthesis monooxygenase [Gammaproteobacteria bacterium]|nr:antibiotic biosynthesis monooxygenase [Gammaproteobacteria bacterium]